MNVTRVAQALSMVLAACLIAACGGVDVERQGDEPLKLLELLPRSGEVNVSSDTDVVAVFSDGMSLGDGPGQINAQTFFVEDAAGTALPDEAELSDLDTEQATAVIHLTGLSAGQSYTIVLKSTLQGGATEPMGVDVRATFTVAE